MYEEETCLKNNEFVLFYFDLKKMSRLEKQNLDLICLKFNFLNLGTSDTAPRHIICIIYFVVRAKTFFQPNYK